MAIKEETEEREDFTVAGAVAAAISPDAAELVVKAAFQEGGEDAAFEAASGALAMKASEQKNLHKK